MSLGKVVGELPSGWHVHDMEDRVYHGDVHAIGYWDNDQGWIELANVTPSGVMEAPLLAASAAFYAQLLKTADLYHQHICQAFGVVEDGDWRRCGGSVCQEHYATLSKVGSPPRRCGFTCYEHEGPILDGKCETARQMLTRGVERVR